MDKPIPANIPDIILGIRIFLTIEFAFGFPKPSIPRITSFGLILDAPAFIAQKNTKIVAKISSNIISFFCLYVAYILF